MEDGHYNQLSVNIIMSCCNIFNKSFIQDADLSNAKINISVLKSFIPEYDADTSGLWRPIVIKSASSTLQYGDLLSEPKAIAPTYIDPCNCNPSLTNDLTVIASNPSINCEYCNSISPANYKAVSKLVTIGNTDYTVPITTPEGVFPSVVSFEANCCQGACDTRMLKDDYLPKIPLLNQKYLNNNFYDFKYLKQFPAISNPGLGFEKFVTIDSLKSFDGNGPQLVIDWDIKERISEIPYDSLISEYDTEHDHNKAYSRSMHTSYTCGNFILTSLYSPEGHGHPHYPLFDNLLQDLPSNEEFQKIPYGFSKNTYDNIFIKKQKIGSHWKWNYSSGILGWYRYYNIHIPTSEDTRPIPKIDLYIPSGDVFYATSEGPEPSTQISTPKGSDGEIKSCPSGLKLIKGSEVVGIIPGGSSFIYISANLYNHFLNIHSRITKTNSSLSSEDRMTSTQIFELAAMLCTAPQYDEYTVDLFKRNISYNYTINDYKQIDILDKHMSTLPLKSASDTHYVETKKSLILTLAKKYGSYLFFPPNSSTSLTLSKSIKSQFAIDFDFDIVAKLSDVKNIPSCDPINSCASTSPSKKFIYEQKINIGQLFSFGSSARDSYIYYDKKCVNNSMIIDKRKIIKTSILSLNGDIVKHMPYSSGCATFQDNYPRIISKNTAGYCYNCTSADYSRFSVDNGPDAMPPDGAENSSYKLFIKTFLNNNEDLCWKNQDDTSFCDYSLGNFYNNSNIGDVYGSRPLRTIKDGTFYFKRSYSALSSNLRIDRVAFHHQGGVYYESKNFEATSGATVFSKNITSLPYSETDKLAIQFNTYDLGIKLYNLNIFKLRSSNSETYSCPAFPNNYACKCFPVSIVTGFPYVCNSTTADGAITYSNSPLYVPAMSTTYSPSILSYGGYTIKDLYKKLDIVADTDSFSFSSIAIPNHPSPGSYLSSVNKKIDPLNPYGCRKDIKTSLYNYVDTNWNLKLTNFHTNHADIWATVSEGVDLFKNISLQEIYNEDIGDFDAYPVPNPGYQRFTSKVDINNNYIYDAQSKVIYSKGSTFSSTININIQNPYLVALLGSNPTLYPATGYVCQGKSIFGSRGDESVVVPITLSCIPRKQLLNFAIKSPSTTYSTDSSSNNSSYPKMGTLRRGFFHPNSGLIYGSKTDQSPVVKVKDTNNLYIEYDKYLFETNASANDPSIVSNSQDTFNDNNIVLIGKLNESVKLTLNQINSFDNNKKLKLYLYLNSKWYEYKTDHAFGFVKNNETYVGDPFLFEYSINDSISKINGPIIPTSAKKHLPFNFVYNYKPIKNTQKIFNIHQHNYPLNNVPYRKLASKTIVIDGIRPYFCFAELDYGIATNVASEYDLNTLSDEVLETLNTLYSSGKPIELILLNGKRLRYKYTDGSFYSRSSYYEVDYNYLYTNYSDLFIDYNKINSLYYVINTNKKCQQTIVIRSKKYNNRYTYNTVIGKAIYSVYVDEYGNAIPTNNQYDRRYIKPYTVLFLYSNLKTDSDGSYDTGYLDFSGLSSSDSYGIDSFTIYNDDILLKKELDEILNNPLYSTKWGDLIQYDGQKTNDLTKYIYDKNYLNNTYPDTLYNNVFYKTIVNDNKKFFNINLSKFNENYNTLNINYAGIKYFNIHQPYNVGLDKFIVNNDYQDYNNYLPFLDINLLPDAGTNNTSIRSLIASYIPSSETGNIFSGIIKISGIYKNIEYTSELTNNNFIHPSNNLFWINIPKNACLESALTIFPNQVFYSNTLRIDDPFFSIVGIDYTNNYKSTFNLSGVAVDCKSTITPSISVTGETFSSKILDFSHFSTSIIGGSIFARFPVYCDTDKVSGCSSSCGVITAGYVSLSGLYNMRAQYKTDIGKNDSIPYIITHDNGIYNIIGNNQFHYIQRFELAPNNPLFPTNNCDTNVQPLPLSIKNSSLSEKYQSILNDNIVSDHSDIVKKTDILANEMLFRIIYGEKQKINLNTLNNNKNLTLKDVLSYTDPKIEAKDIYNNIPYDLDINADQEDVKINGNITIRGVVGVGKAVTVNIGGNIMSFDIVRETTSAEPTITRIKMKMTYGLDTYESTIHTETTQVRSYIATTGTISGPNISESAVAQCNQPAYENVSYLSVLTKATIDGTAFPYWSDLSNCPTSGDHPRIAFSVNAGCAPAVMPFSRCTNRGVVHAPEDAIIGSPNCTILGGSSAKVNPNGYARGIFSQGCVGIGGPTSWSVLDDDGGPDDFAGGTVIASAAGAPATVTPADAVCGTCMTFDGAFDGGNEYFNVYKPVEPAMGSCECRDWEYGYCSASNDASKCVCKTLAYDYSDFSYNFGYCRYSFSFAGYRRKLKYPKDLFPTYSIPLCKQVTAPTYSPGTSNRVSNMQEFCGAVSCILAPALTWNVYRVTNSSYSAYVPSTCVVDYCSINYTNDKIKINFINGSKTVCLNINKIIGCPVITITVPDSTYIIRDTIDSECSTCENSISNDGNNIESVPSVPGIFNLGNISQNWETVDETRTCVLGELYLGGGSANSNFITGMGKQVRSCAECGGCDPNKCRTDVTVGGAGICGKSAPDSYPWAVCISKGTTGTCNNTLYGCDTPLDPNPLHPRGHALWREAMQRAYANVAPCSSNQDINSNNILEGIIGKCGTLQFKTINIKGVAFRSTLSGTPMTKAFTAQYEVAYFTYTHRRRKNIQDILKGEISKKCYEATSRCPTVPYIREKFEFNSCNNGLRCYNNPELPSCESNKYCCKVNKNEP